MGGIQVNKTDYEKLGKSLDELKEQYESFLTLDEQGLSEVNQRAVKNSVIKCFEICFDTLWKHIKKYLQEQNGLVELGNSPKQLFRDAHENQLFDKEIHKRLVRYLKIRNDAAHDYSIEKAMAALGEIDDFIQDAAEIYEAMIQEE